MARYPIYRVDAFTDRPLAGNPAAVMPLESWLPEETMQAVAAENNLSETAYFVREGDAYAIRWFTPTCEVPLCGHATLASSWVIFERLDPDARSIRFTTRERGDLVVTRGEAGRLVMDFPAAPTKAMIVPEGLDRLLGARSLEVHKVRDKDMLVVLDSADTVRRLSPDVSAVPRTLGISGVIVTAEADVGSGADFVCRYFAPGHGVAEDPVTGSIHTFLVPFWAKRLGKTELVSHQLSARGGVLYCRDRGERTEIAGDAVLTLEGEVIL